MKKLILLFSLIFSAQIWAADVDLQIINVAPSNDGINVIVQNNGPDTFAGVIMIRANSNGKDYYSELKPGHNISIPLFMNAEQIGSTCNIVVDPNNEVIETKEFNNEYLYVPGKSNFRICNNFFNVDEEYFRDMIFLLPGEYFSYWFDVKEMNQAKKIIGLNASVYFNSPSVCENLVYNTIKAESGDFYNGVFTLKEDGGFTWMVNKSQDAIYGFNLGSFAGTTIKGNGVAENGSIYVSVEVATSDLKLISLQISKVIKKIDRIRCDVNGDGVADRLDLEIMNKVVDQGLFNHRLYMEGLNTQNGLNYGAGIVLFGHPDFLSNCLFNIWLNNNADPLVLGLGIGDLMSDQPNITLEKVKNNSYLSGNNLIIDAPNADIYDVTAYLPDGKLFQKTGKIGEQITVPDESLDYKVETIKLKNNNVYTALFGQPKENKNSVYFYNNELKISGEENLNIKVFDLSGKSIFYGKSENETIINTNSWSNGIYLIKVNNQSFKIVK